MLMDAAVWKPLLEAGFTVDPVGPEQVVLALPGQEASATLLTVVSLCDPLSPSHVMRLGSRHPLQRVLLVVPSASPKAVEVATTQNWSVLTTSGRGSRLVLGNTAYDVSAPSDTDTHLARSRTRGRPAYGTFAVVRRLLAGGALTQAELASRTNMSQPRVSQILTDLKRQGLVDRCLGAGAGGWMARDWEELLAWWLARYPGPGGVATSWFGLRPPREQAVAAVAAVDLMGGRAVVSGDVAADELAPWRRPVGTVLYVDLSDAQAPDLAGVLAQSGLTPCGVDERTTEIRFPADPAVWGEERSRLLPLADPIQVLWDLRRGGGAGVDEAAAALTSVLGERVATHGGPS